MLRLWTGFQIRIVREEEGAELVEYLLVVALIALIALVAMVAVVLFGSQLTGTFNKVANSPPQ